MNKSPSMGSPANVIAGKRKTFVSAEEKGMLTSPYQDTVGSNSAPGNLFQHLNNLDCNLDELEAVFSILSESLNPIMVEDFPVPEPTFDQPDVRTELAARVGSCNKRVVLTTRRLHHLLSRIAI
jgi:hypothetical protein